MARALQKKLGMGGHHAPHHGETNDWLTPPEIIKALGAFDLDPCCPPSMPWKTAGKMLTGSDDGLSARWAGRVWLNPPYGAEAAGWLERLGDHGRGTALIFARTETDAWHRWVWPRATAVLFLRGRLYFHYPDGTRAKANAGAPSALVAYGSADAWSLQRSGIAGKFLMLEVPA